MQVCSYPSATSSCALQSSTCATITLGQCFAIPGSSLSAVLSLNDATSYTIQPLSSCAIGALNGTSMSLKLSTCTALTIARNSTVGTFYVIIHENLTLIQVMALFAVDLFPTSVCLQIYNSSYMIFVMRFNTSIDVTALSFVPSNARISLVPNPDADPSQYVFPLGLTASAKSSSSQLAIQLFSYVDYSLNSLSAQGELYFVPLGNYFRSDSGDDILTSTSPIPIVVVQFG